MTAPLRAGRAAQPLDVSTVRVLHDALRASLRLRAGRDPGWTWRGHPEREFLRGVRGHRVAGTIAPHRADLGFSSEFGEGIAAAADRVAMTSLAQAGALRQVHHRLATAGIPALFVKGLAVEAQTGRRLGDRGGGDIDVWVSPGHVEAAITELRPEWTLPRDYPQPGPSWAWRHWRAWGSELPLRGPVTVDLHWHLHCVRDILPDFAEAWAARETVSVGGHLVPTLSRPHALAHACRHAATDRWRILRSLVDIHLLLGPAAGAKPPALPDRTVAVVERSIGLPSGPAATRLSAAEWSAVLDEQRHLGTHAEHTSQLPRTDYLRRILGRLDRRSRQPARDLLAMLWFLAVPPPHQLGPITTTSTVRGVSQGIARRVRYELGRK